MRIYQKGDDDDDDDDRIVTISKLDGWQGVGTPAGRDVLSGEGEG
jgi:hypothetical protein